VNSIEDAVKLYTEVLELKANEIEVVELVEPKASPHLTKGRAAI